MALRASGCPGPEGTVGQLLHERANRIGGRLSVSGDDPVTVVLTAP